MTESMRTAFAALPDSQRAVLHLTHQGCSYNEVAARLDVPVAVVFEWGWQALVALGRARTPAPRVASEP